MMTIKEAYKWIWIQDAAERFVKAPPKLTPDQEEYIRQNIVLAHASADMIKSMTNTAQKMETNNNNVQTTNVDVGGVNIHLDGSNVVDKESFRRTLRDYEVRSDIEQIALGDLTKGSIRNSMRRI